MHESAFGGGLWAMARNGPALIIKMGVPGKFSNWGRLDPMECICGCTIHQTIVCELLHVVEFSC